MSITGSVAVALCRNGLRKRAATSVTARRTLPVIDIGPLFAGRAETCVATAHELDTACREYGFFHIAGHGIAAGKVQDVLAASRLFFDLPFESKAAVRAGAGEGTGWEPPGAQKVDEGRLGEGVDGAATMEQGDVKESYILGRPATAQLPPGAVPGELAALWPDALGAEFKAPLLAYHDECWRVCTALMRGFALALDKPDDFFMDDVDDPMTKLRILQYPADDGRYRSAAGIGAHTDWGALTLLAQDDVGGLEVCAADGEWLPADRAAHDTLLVNVGDMLQRWTNGRYRSAPHRVLAPSSPVRQRQSVAFFFNCNVDAMVDPRVVVPTEEPRWAPIRAEDYILERAAATYRE